MLSQEIATLLRARGPLPVDVIAGTVRARRSDVAEVLRTGPFYVASAPLGANPSACYFAASPGVPRAEKVTPASKVSQLSRILSVLADRRWHSYREIHQRAGYSRLNSRVSEARSRGYDIECDKTGGDYRYRLISTPDDLLDEPAAASPDAGRGAPSPSVVAGSSSGPQTGSVDPPVEPSLAEGEARSILTLFHESQRGAYGEAA